jgi:lipoprotein-releasing system ATP-binding protein
MIPPQAELRVESIVHQYSPPRGPTVLKGVSFTASPGDSVAITGPSGSGKSTLLNLIGSLDRPTAGQVWLGKTAVSELCGPALAGYRAREVGFVFQDHLLMPQLTALENVLLPTLAMKRDDAVEPAGSLLARVGLLNRAGSFPRHLSGGERQRVAIARAMVNSPRLLLCDEPTGNLDRDTGTQVAHVLLDLAKQHQAIVLIVTHNPEICRMCSRAMELRDGLLVDMPISPT